MLAPGATGPAFPAVSKPPLVIIVSCKSILQIRSSIEQEKQKTVAKNK